MFHAVKEYCKSSIEGITFQTIDKEDMVAVRENLKLWYELGDTVPGTRSCRYLVPTSQYTIEGKQLSIDTNVFITHSFLDMPAPQNETLNTMTTLLAALMGFGVLHPQQPSGQFHWPCGDDRGYAPLKKVIMNIQVPTMSAN